MSPAPVPITGPAHALGTAQRAPLVERERPVLKEKPAADYLGISVALLRKWRFTGRGGPRHLKYGHLVRYRIQDLDTFMESSTVVPAPLKPRGTR